MRPHQLSHLFLLVHEGVGGVDAGKAELIDQPAVFAADDALEESE